MEDLKMTKEVFSLIISECKKFRQNTNEMYDLTIEDVLYSLLFSEPDSFYILNDWDEGKNNDPFWDNGKNQHCTTVFLIDICEKIKSNFC